MVPSLVPRYRFNVELERAGGSQWSGMVVWYGGLVWWSGMVGKQGELRIFVLQSSRVQNGKNGSLKRHFEIGDELELSTCDSWERCAVATVVLRLKRGWYRR